MGRGCGGRRVPESCCVPPAAAAAITRRRQRLRASHSVFIWTQIGITYFRAVNDKYRGGGGATARKRRFPAEAPPRDVGRGAAFLLGAVAWQGPVGGRGAVGGGLLCGGVRVRQGGFSCCGGTALSAVARLRCLAVAGVRVDISPYVAERALFRCTEAPLLLASFFLTLL